MYLGAVGYEVHLGEAPRSRAMYSLKPYRFADALDAQVPPSSGGLAKAVPSTGHTVRNGENLTTIVKDRLEALGKPASPAQVYDAVREVTQFNRMRNPDLIHPGQRIDLSPLGSLAAPAPKVQPVADKSYSAPPSPVSPVAAKSVKLPEVPATPAPANPLLSDQPKPFVLVAAKESVTGRGGAVPRPSLRGLRSDALGESLTKQVKEVLYGDDGETQARQTGSPWSSTLGGPARLSSGYGYRRDPFTGRRAFHKGVDLAAPTGTEIFPVKAGKVEFSGWQRGYGRVVIVRHDDTTETVYAHNNKNLVSKGMRVAAGQQIAEVGSMGRSTGPHLHFEVRRNGRAIDPMPYLKQHAGRTVTAKL